MTNQQPEYYNEPMDAPVVESIKYRHSDELGELFGALALAQAEISSAVKDKVAKVQSTKGNYQYSYSDLHSVIEAGREPLAKNGICVIQLPNAAGQRVTVTTVLGHKSGQWWASDLTMSATQNTPQGIGSAITYGRRYGLSAMAGIASEDDDGQAASQRPPQQRYEREPEPKYQPPKKQVESAPSASDILWQRMKNPKDVLAYLGECKTLLTDITGSDLEYYSVLKRGGIHDLEALKAITMEKAKPIVRDMQETVVRTQNMFVTPAEVA
jgi:hypothetical protein